MSWWKKLFGKEKDPEAVQAAEQFNTQLQEALLRQVDLKTCAAEMKAERVKRLKQTQSNRTTPAEARQKLSSQPTG